MICEGVLLKTGELKSTSKLLSLGQFMKINDPRWNKVYKLHTEVASKLIDKPSKRLLSQIYKELDLLLTEMLD